MNLTYSTGQDKTTNFFCELGKEEDLDWLEGKMYMRCTYGVWRTLTEIGFCFLLVPLEKMHWCL